MLYKMVAYELGRDKCKNGYDTNSTSLFIVPCIHISVIYLTY